MKNKEDFWLAMSAFLVVILIFVVIFFIGEMFFNSDRMPLSLSRTEKLLSDIRNNSNDRDIMDCARLHIQGKEEILLGDMWDFYDCKNLVLQDRLKRAIPASPDAKN